MLQCIYELFTSLKEGRADEYTWDIYTALSYGSAIGILTGLAAVDGQRMYKSPMEDALKAKATREANFPVVLMTKGMTFDCAKGEASVATDKDRIMARIGGTAEQQQLNRSVHARIAAASLRSALEQGGELAVKSMQAIRVGRLARFELVLTGSAADTVQNVQSLVEALDPQALQQLALYSQCWKRANQWLTAALAGRVFAKLLKLDLQSDLF